MCGLQISEHGSSVDDATQLDARRFGGKRYCDGFLKEIEGNCSNSRNYGSRDAGDKKTSHPSLLLCLLEIGLKTRKIKRIR